MNLFSDDLNSKEYETIISEIARYLFEGNSPLYYILQASTALILVLASNTALLDKIDINYQGHQSREQPGDYSKS